MTENPATSATADLGSSRNLGSFRARIHLPYRSSFNRIIRVIGMLTLLASSLGLLAAVAGFPLNWLSMLLALLASLILIGFSVRPSQRRARF